MRPSEFLTRLPTALAAATLALCCAHAERTPLDDYVEAPDPHYAHHVVRTVQGSGYSADVIELTSQKWLTEEQVNQPLWKHWLTVIRPDTVASRKALLFITGGSNGRQPPNAPDIDLARVAVATGSVCTELRMVPNQPLRFNGDDTDRTEDDLISVAWTQYLKTGDPLWLPRLPMTKSAVRAMDTIQEHCARDEAGRLQIDGFVVAGGSKRGWTTWTTAAVDRRVVAIVPIVVDMLNIEPSFQHHYRSYGFFAPAVGDYQTQSIMDFFGVEAFADLKRIVEPYEYRDRLRMPKLILNAAGDQYFCPDSWQFYFDDLPGIKYLRYVPNADHSMRDTDALETLVAWHHAILRDQPLPRFDWKLADGSYDVAPLDTPSEVRLWKATNPRARDFRVETLGRVWESRTLQPDDQGRFSGRIPIPRAGWTAYMVELTYRLPETPAPLKLTTGVRIVPDHLPHPPYEPRTAP